MQERRNRALEWRRRGLTIRQIAARLECSVGRAHQLIEEAIAAIPRENAEAVRMMELERIDRMLRGLWRPSLVDVKGNLIRGGALDGEPKAVAASVKLMERRARLLGLDAPVKQEISGKDGGPIELAALQSAMAAAAANDPDAKAASPATVPEGPDAERSR